MTEDKEIHQSKYQAGDMLWGRVSGHPWWPCMVAKGPDSSSHFRTIKRRQNIQVQYHVQYFGEENERGWISEASLMPYIGRAAFERMQEERLNPNAGNIPTKKDKQSYIINSRRQKAWSTAVVRAEEALGLSMEERLSRYAFIYPEVNTTEQPVAKTPPKKRKRRESSRSSEDGVDRSMKSFSDSINETAGEGEPDNGNNSDSSSAAVSLARAGVRSGRAIKHTSRFVKHLKDIMKKKVKPSSHQKDGMTRTAPPSSHETSLNISNSRPSFGSIKVEKDNEIDQSTMIGSNELLPMAVTPNHPQQARGADSMESSAFGNHIQIKVEPMSDPFAEAQMLQQFPHEKDMRHLAQRCLPQECHQEYLQQQPSFNLAQHIAQLVQQQQQQVIHVQPLDPPQNHEESSNQIHNPPKKRQKLGSTRRNPSLDQGGLIHIRPIPELKEEVLTSIEMMASTKTMASTKATASTDSTRCNVATNTDIDMPRMNNFLRRPDSLEIGLQTSPALELERMEESAPVVGADSDDVGVQSAGCSRDGKNYNAWEGRGCESEADAKDGEVLDDGKGASVLEERMESAEEGKEEANVALNPTHVMLNGLPNETDALNVAEMEDLTGNALVNTSIQSEQMENFDESSSHNDPIDSEMGSLLSSNLGRDVDDRREVAKDLSGNDEEEQDMEVDLDSKISSSVGSSTPASSDSFYEPLARQIPAPQPKPEVVLDPLNGVMVRLNRKRFIAEAHENNEGQKADENLSDKICLQCQCMDANLVKCTGPCQGHYHLSCVGLLCAKGDTFECTQCDSGLPFCFVCKLQSPDILKCSVKDCGKLYHRKCLSKFFTKPIGLSSIPQNGMTSSSSQTTSFTCPRHVCVTCAMETGKSSGRVSKGPMYRCLKCPRSFHANKFCLPASCRIVEGLNVICNSHTDPEDSNSLREFACDWCAVCLEGDKHDETPDIIQNHRKQHQGCRPNECLFTCSTCPLSFHPSCYKVSPCIDAWSCKDCLVGRNICYGDVVWAKMSTYRWWPGRVLQVDEFKKKSSASLLNKRRSSDVAVQFYGTKMVMWLPWYRLLRFEEGEHLLKEYAHRHLMNAYELGTSIASEEYEKRASQKNSELSLYQKSGTKPSPYKHVKTNMPLGGVEITKAPPSENPSCQCIPDDSGYFCGPDSDCINRLMLYECHPQVCQGGEKCLNQRFTRREDADIKPMKTQEKGWGLFAQASLEKGQFISEYVGDLIDSKECKRRLEEAQINGIKNFYMLTLDKNRIIDAGPKGNYTRFMNHSCEPNCETQKWTVSGDIRVGLFTLKDIPKGTELNFNYNLDCFGNEKTKCKCDSTICSGFLGVRPKTAVAVEVERKSLEIKLKREQINQQYRKKGRKSRPPM